MTTEQIEIYVRSSALGPVGIHWRNVSKLEQPKEEPEILAQQVVPDESSKISIDSAINTVKPCLVLAKYDGKVLLEVTGIDATRERSKKEGRRISEVVLWVGDANEETEKQLRKLAHCALLGLWEPESKFRTAISSSIEFDGLNDYKVNSDVLKDIYTYPEKYTDSGLETPDSSDLDYLKPHTIEVDKDIAQLAKQLRRASFGGLDTAIIIAEIKQTGNKRWLNYRTHIVEILKVKPARPSISQADRKESSAEGSAFPEQGTKKKEKMAEASPSLLRIVQNRRRLATLALLILILISLLWTGQKYIINQKIEIEPYPPVLEIVPTPQILLERTESE